MNREEVCSRCDGCGRIADSDEGEPWTAWSDLPPGSDLAVQMGLVKPIPCPKCGGNGPFVVRCNQAGCAEIAGYRFTWPGRDEAHICEEHVGKLRGVAAAISIHLQVIPL